jgi:phytoene synthase
MSRRAEAALLRRVRATGTSFYWTIRLLPRGQRRAMAALYLFCRAVDDIADGPAEAATKRRQLDQWRHAAATPGVACPDRALGEALADALRDHDLPVEELQAVVDGVAMDLPPGCPAPDAATLALYCRRVAGAVGILSMRIYGCRSAQAEAFAVAAGNALQRTNILRDVAEDAAAGRLYLPCPALEAAGLHDRDPAAVLAHPALPSVLAAVAAEAEAFYEDAFALARALPLRDRRRARPGLALVAVYRLLLRRLGRRGWSRPEVPPRLGRGRVIATLLRWRILGA